MSDVHILPTLEKKPTRRVIIAGTRTYRGGIDGVARAVKAAGFDIEVVLSGCGPTVSQAAEQWAARHSKRIDSPRRTTKQRNALLAQHADALIALWDGESDETRELLALMADRPTIVYWETGW